MPHDALADLRRQVQPRAVALQMLHDAQGVLVVAEVKALAEALAQARVEHLLADVRKRWVTEVVAQPDRLRQVLVQPQRARHGARDRGHLERVREPGTEVIALRRHEHLRLMHEPPERLAVNDPVAVTLEGRPQRAVVLGPFAPCGI